MSNPQAKPTFFWDFTPEEDSRTFRIYSKAKREQWDAAADIDWTLPHVLNPEIAAVSPGLAREMDRSAITQVYFGEQAAVAGCARLVNAAPDMESRLFLTSQVFDEGRHVEVFGRFLEALGGVRRCSPHLFELLDRVLECQVYEAMVLGTHILFEGSALITLRAMHRTTASPLLSAILKSVLRDERRHTGFGEDQLRMRADRLSPALRRELEDTMSDWWKLFARVYHTDDAELLTLVPPHVAKVIAESWRLRLDELAKIQVDMHERLRRYGLTFRCEPVVVRSLAP
jgi:hypothetical protein